MQVTAGTPDTVASNSTPGVYLNACRGLHGHIQVLNLENPESELRVADAINNEGSHSTVAEAECFSFNTLLT